MKIFEWLRRRGVQNAGPAWKPDASFRGWTFFDTNCLSELVKLCRAGERQRVHQFVNGRTVLLFPTVLQELRHAMPVASGVPDALATANVFMVPTPTRFWECDLQNYLGDKGSDKDVLGPYRAPAPMFQLLDSEPRLRASFERAEKHAREQFSAEIELARSVGVDEPRVGTLVWDKVAEIARTSFGITISPEECRSEHFPAFYTYYYPYYFRYLTPSPIVHDPNDFNDFAHAIAAPYCTEFYVERKLGNVLRRQVQGRKPATPYAVAKRLVKTGYMDQEKLTLISRNQQAKVENRPLLTQTSIVTFSEMLEKIRAL